MAKFSYRALDKGNDYVKGAIDALNRKKALAKLEGEGLLVVGVQKEKKFTWGKLAKIATISRQDKIFFTRHLYTFLEAGIALDHAIKIAAEQATNPKFQDILMDIYERVQKGQKLHTALLSHKSHFSEFFINLIKVGEASGTLDRSLQHLLEQQEKDYELITKSRGAMIYPGIIIIAAILMVTFMMTFVIPTIASVLITYGGELPLPTKILIFLSNTVVNYGLVILPLLILLMFGFYKFIKSDWGKRYWDLFLLRAPFVWRVVVEFNLARFARSMNATLQSGVSIDASLELAAKVCGNVYYQEAIYNSIQFVQKGIKLTEILGSNSRLFPPLTTRMIEIGENTGNMDNMFKRLANFYEKSVVNTFTNLSSVIEPVLLLLIGLVVGFVAVSILTPIWKFAETF